MSKAVIKYLRLSPTKARLIARQIQGMNAELAMASLKFMPNKGAKFIASAISSAVANGGFEANEVEVVSCRVDAGAVLKRFQPRARGSASRIRKPSSHILVVVEKIEEKTQSKKAKNSSKAENSNKNSSSKTKNSSQNSVKTTKASENVAKAVNSKENSSKAVNSSEKKAENSTKNVNSSEAKAENSSKAASEDKKAENSSSKNSKTAKGEAKKAPARAKKSETKED